MDAVVARPGEGEIIVDHPAGGIVIKGAHEQVVVSEVRLSPGTPGPPPHVHHHHSDAFYVLEGTLTVRLGGEERPLHPGGFVRIPPNVVHTVGNADEGAPVRALNLHAPSMGFDDYLRAGRDGDQAARERFDQHDPPADGGRPASDARVLDAGEGEPLRFGPTSAVFKATGDDDAGHFSLSETTAAPGFPGPVAHVHRTFVDSFYVLEGTLTVRLGEETLGLDAGTFALVPPGTVHTFSNPGDEPVRFLNLMAPGGFERYLREVVAAATSGGPPDQALMAEIASRYDFEPAA
ncbi:MAG TPA: cupin domain-containing protein [Thermoleophilaceae bacterium]